jgi:energy-coupling factor transporter ATP-binding protein EcfA2
VDFSRDGVTVLVGQNESGKTSVLQALDCALGGSPVTPDDKRINAADPRFQVRVQVSATDAKAVDALDEASAVEVAAFMQYLKEKDGVVEIELWRTAKPPALKLTELNYRLLDHDRYAEILELAEKSLLSDQDAHNDTPPNTPVPVPPVTPTPVGAASSAESDGDRLDARGAAALLYGNMPLATLFSAETGLLPNTVDIDEKGAPSGPGSTAAANYLSIAEIDLPSLVKGDGRYRQNILNRANQRLTDDFATFWSQVIGAKSKLSLQCAFEHYGAGSGPEKIGKPYLEFWISDGNTQLYPRQRSQGVRWFVSFYLQLRATERSKYTRVFLLDEPGANLHDKAQEDVLRLIDTLRTEIPIVYSTHSPKMIEYEKLFRIRAVQRTSEVEDSPTTIIDAHHLGAASSDTLSPLLSAMGSDMSQQAVVKKNRNVLLEEISGYYYLKGFWNLLGRKEEAHFIAATGVNKIPQLANMFLGWGIDFVVAVDDDKQGREVYNQLKKDLCADKDDAAKRLLLKFPGCTSIEEVFSRADFKKHILKDESANVQGSNSEYLKDQKISKPVTALEFRLSVDSGKLSLKNFDEETRAKIREVTDAICTLLSSREEKATIAKK